MLGKLFFYFYFDISMPYTVGYKIINSKKIQRNYFLCSYKQLYIHQKCSFLIYLFISYSPKTIRLFTQIKHQRNNTLNYRAGKVLHSTRVKTLTLKTIIPHWTEEFLWPKQNVSLDLIVSCAVCLCTATTDHLRWVYVCVLIYCTTIFEKLMETNGSSRI